MAMRRQPVNFPAAHYEAAGEAATQPPFSARGFYNEGSGGYCGLRPLPIMIWAKEAGDSLLHCWFILPPWLSSRRQCISTHSSAAVR